MSKRKRGAARYTDVQKLWKEHREAMALARQGLHLLEGSGALDESAAEALRELLDDVEAGLAAVLNIHPRSK